MGSIPAVKLLLTYEASPQLQHLGSFHPLGDLVSENDEWKELFMELLLQRKVQEEDLDHVLDSHTKERVLAMARRSLKKSARSAQRTKET